MYGYAHYNYAVIRIIDASYTDPLGDLPPRPKTASKRQQEEDDFQDAEVGDDLLPD